jgi:chemotaxis signal transduction protein
LQGIVYSDEGKRVGLVIDRILDIVEESIQAKSPASRFGVLYIAIIQGRVTELLDMPALLGAFERKRTSKAQRNASRSDSWQAQSNCAHSSLATATSAFLSSRCRKSSARNPVPLAPRVVRGLINLRGQILTAIDLRRRLNSPERLGDQLPLNVVVRTAEGALSLLVDEIGDVVEVLEDTFERS